MGIRAAALLALLASSIAVPGAATERPDWVVVRLEIGAGGAQDVAVAVTGRASDLSDEPTLVGFGYSYGFDRLVDVIPTGAGTVRVSTTDQAGSVEVAVAPVTRSRALDITSTLRIDGPIAPHTTLGLLVFVTGSSFEQLSVAVPPGMTASTSSGTGSTAISVSGPSDEGVGAAAGPAAVAWYTTHAREVPAGMVGAFVSSGFCLHCSATWASPDGAGAYTSGAVTRSPDEDAVFYGRAGSWRWTWRGAGVNQGSGVPVAPTVAAYATVGDIWPLFRPLSF